MLFDASKQAIYVFENDSNERTGVTESAWAPCEGCGAENLLAAARALQANPTSL